jgi:hypothetical protein
MPSKIYPNRDFWFENKPSGKPGREIGLQHILHFLARFLAIKWSNDFQYKRITKPDRRNSVKKLNQPKKNSTLVGM